MSNSHTALIWLLLDSRNSGGIESHVLQLALGLDKYQLRVCVVFIKDYGEHPLRNALKANAIGTFSLDGSIISLWRALKRDKPDVVHSHGYKAGLFARLLLAFGPSTLAATYHAGEKTEGKLGFYCWLDRHSARLAKLIFAVSPQIAAQLPSRTQIVDNFVDISSGLNPRPTQNTGQIAFVGRLSHEKGPDRFIHLARCHPRHTFHIYGSGPMRTALFDIATDNVRFHGHNDEMGHIWRRIGLLVIPSRHEGLPMVALEAMARGIPVLANRVGALDQVIKHGQNGWLVDPDKPQALDHCLCDWLKMDPQRRLTFQQSAKETIARRFSTDVAIPKLIEAYQSTHCPGLSGPRRMRGKS